MGNKLLFMCSAASLVIFGGSVWAQDAKECRGNQDYPSITGRWRDDGNGLEVVIRHENAVRHEEGSRNSYFVTADYLTPQTCSRPRKDGTIQKIDHDFEGTFVPPKLDGNIRICYWEGGYTTELAVPDLRLTMSKDGMTLSGSYGSRDGVQQVTYTRLSQPHYDLRQWTEVSIASGTKIYKQPEPGSQVNLTVSEKADFQIISAVLDKDGNPSWYSVTRSGYPVGKDYGWIPVDQVTCKKPPAPAQDNTR